MQVSVYIVIIVHVVSYKCTHLANAHRLQAIMHYAVVHLIHSVYLNQCCIQKMYLEGAYTNFSRFRGGGYVTAANSNYRNFAWGGGGGGSRYISPPCS